MPDLLNSGIEALSVLLDPSRLAWLLLGIGLGLVIGLIPGFAGVVGLAIMLPFIYGMDPYAGIALLIGMSAVNTTSDTFPAVLIGVPGSAGSQATVLDGYPLAQQGQAGRALGASFFANMIGGLIGALCLWIAIPVAKPIILALGSPELLMLTLLGVSMVGVLSRSAPVKGLIAGLGGLLLSSVGAALVDVEYRFTFGQLYLYDGISIIVIALGIFAIPEILDLLVQNRPISKSGMADPKGGLLTGIKDVIRYKWFVVRSSIVGVFLGIVPGIGGSVIDWFLYGITVSTAKDTSKFGKGDIRGVIAPEAANNAKDGGSLIPTLFLGIPASGGMAVLLGGMLLLGVQAGPNLLQSDDGNTFMLVVVWTLVLANVIATGVCMGLTRFMSKISLVPPRKLAPFLIIMVGIASYQASEHWLDLAILVVIGVLSWWMKQVGWPRPPLLIGFVLGIATERYLTLSMSRYGYEWLGRSGVIIIGVLILLGIALALRTKPIFGDEATSDDVRAQAQP